MRNKIYLVILFLVLLAKNAFALIEVDITRGNLNPLPIAISPLYLDGKSSEELNKILNQKDLGSKILERKFQK